jgi:hypothetical protein
MLYPFYDLYLCGYFCFGIDIKYQHIFSAETNKYIERCAEMYKGNLEKFKIKQYRFATYLIQVQFNILKINIEVNVKRIL